MQRLDGRPLGDAGPVIAERGLDRHAQARALLEFMPRQILVDGVFHADPHPGNILVLGDGRLGLLDFGSVGRLDPSLPAALKRPLLAMDRGDPLPPATRCSRPPRASWRCCCSAPAAGRG